MDLSQIDVASLPPAAQAQLQLYAAGKPLAENLDRITEHPMETQERLLMEIIRTSEDTEFGREHDFKDIHSIEEFRERVPVSTYDDYAEYILRQTEDGEEHLLTGFDVHHYNKTSGTMGNPKRIPMSDRALEVFKGYLAALTSARLIDRFGFGDWVGQKSLNLTEADPEVPRLKDGSTYSAVSAKTNHEIRPILEALYVSPDEAIFPRKGTNTRYIHARFGLADRDITQASASFFSFFLELMRYIEGNWELLVDDIEKGTISVDMDPDVKEALLAKIEPMPERAAELREIFSQGFDEPFGPKVWPNLKVIYGIGTGGFKAYADQIRERYLGPDVPQLKWGISASEGVFTAAYDFDREDTVLLPDSVFYEFLPLDADDDLSQIRTMDELEEGRDYELIVTNLSGLYRYRMRDAVRVTGRYHETPTVEFLYRIDQTLSIMGEKTTEVALRAAVDAMAEELGLEVIDFSVIGDLDARPVRYTYYLELGRIPEGLKPKEIRYVLEEKLAEANPSMGDKVEKGIVGKTKVNFLEPETYMLYRDLMLNRGVASGQLKPVRIINNELQRRFFNGTTEYSYEVVD